MQDEWFELVDEEGRRVGRARRSECHGNPDLMHRSVHVLVVDGAGRIFLQKRAASKDIQPGKWDSSVGGHVMPGEEPDQAAVREMIEELSVRPESLDFAYRYVWRTPVESELVTTFLTRHDGPFRVQPAEIDEGRFWAPREIEAAMGTGLFTPNFEHEYARFRERALN